jgi:hypothetical protein
MVRIDDEPVVDLVDEALIDNLRHVAGIAARRIGRSGSDQGIVDDQAGRAWILTSELIASERTTRWMPVLRPPQRVATSI